MFKLIAGKKYVRRNGEVVTLKQYQGHPGLLTDDEWVFVSDHPDNDGYRVFHYPSPHDIVAPYKTPRKASSPYKKLLTAKQGAIFLLKGEKFIVKESMNIFVTGIYLTSCDRHNPHGYRSIHVRNGKTGGGVFSRQDLIDLLRSGKYIVE